MYQPFWPPNSDRNPRNLRHTRNPRNPKPSPPWPQGLGRWLLLSLLVGLSILWLKLYPFNFGPAVGPLFGMEHDGYLAVLGQIALFLPLGAVEAQVARRLLGGFTALALLLVIVDALLLSLIGETVQHWLPTRNSSLIDLLANALGAAVGYQLAMLLSMMRRRG